MILQADIHIYILKNIFFNIDALWFSSCFRQIVRYLILYLYITYILDTEFSSWDANGFYKTVYLTFSVRKCVYKGKYSFLSEDHDS